MKYKPRIHGQVCRRVPSQTPTDLKVKTVNIITSSDFCCFFFLLLLFYGHCVCARARTQSVTANNIYYNIIVYTFAHVADTAIRHIENSIFSIIKIKQIISPTNIYINTVPDTHTHTHTDEKKILFHLTYNDNISVRSKTVVLNYFKMVLFVKLY